MQSLVIPLSPRRAGNMQMSYNYTINNKGIDRATSYPYTGHQGSCAYKAGAVGATFSGWRQVSGAADGTGVVNISAIQLAVATMGPVAVGIDADSALHQFYHGGFFSGNCTFGTGILGRRTAPFPPFPYS